METSNQQTDDVPLDKEARENELSTARHRVAKQMPHQPATETAVSAPGKVLLTGGYLVLDRQYSGAVYALDARVHVVVQQLQKDKDGKIAQRLSVPESCLQAKTNGHASKDSNGQQHNGTPREEETGDVVIVRSAQFVDAVWEYRVVRMSHGGGIKVVQLNDGPSNPFVETSLNFALTYVNYVAASNSFGSLAVTILADNDYYSETACTTTLNGRSSRSRFRKAGVRLHEAHKTGLGSSAALVTALVCALVAHRTVHPEDLQENTFRLHNLAQAVHCVAQGKVGSGFDIAAAIFGSCLYRRFSPGVLGGLGDVGSPEFETRLFSVVEDLNPDAHWNARCSHVGFQLPRGLQMVLCDVDCGSQTPGMVRKVLEWREHNRGEADEIWKNLQYQNEVLHLELRRLAEEDEDDPNFDEVRQCLLECRHWIRKMTVQAQVPIEPTAQTALLEGLSRVDGVVGGLVPGAGGYDAVALLVRDDEAEVVERIRAFVEKWKSPVADDFGGKIGRVRLLDVRHGAEGVRSEHPMSYSGWTL